jgi:hypothetical protein
LAAAPASVVAVDAGAVEDAEVAGGLVGVLHAANDKVSAAKMKGNV